jgi:hypothetical protein
MPDGDNPDGWTYADFNDPRLNQLEGGLAHEIALPRLLDGLPLLP